MIRKNWQKASPFPPYPKNWNWTALTSKVISLISEDASRKRSGNSRNPDQPELMKQERQTAAARMDSRRFSHNTSHSFMPALFFSAHGIIRPVHNSSKIINLRISCLHQLFSPPGRCGLPLLQYTRISLSVSGSCSGLPFPMVSLGIRIALGYGFHRILPVSSHPR